MRSGAAGARAVEASGHITADELLAEARADLERLTPSEVQEAIADDEVVIDIRSLEQRLRDGELPGARVVARNVLEWRLDPRGDHRDPELARQDCRIVIVCDEGYQSSLAAANLRRFGVDATDMIGGVQGWIAEGLPIEPQAAR